MNAARAHARLLAATGDARMTTVHGHMIFMRASLIRLRSSTRRPWSCAPDRRAARSFGSRLRVPMIPARARYPRATDAVGQAEDLLADFRAEIGQSRDARGVATHHAMRALLGAPRLREVVESGRQRCPSRHASQERRYRAARRCPGLECAAVGASPSNRLASIRKAVSAPSRSSVPAQRHRPRRDAERRAGASGGPAVG